MITKKYCSIKSLNCQETWPTKQPNSDSLSNSLNKMPKQSPISNSSLKKLSKFCNCQKNVSKGQSRRLKQWTQRSRCYRAICNSFRHFQKASQMPLTNWRIRNWNWLKKKISWMIFCLRLKVSFLNSTKENQWLIAKEPPFNRLWEIWKRTLTKFKKRWKKTKVVKQKFSRNWTI